MKNIIVVTFLIGFFSFPLFSQSNQNPYNHFIVLTNNDTLKNIKISKNPMLTNEDRLGFERLDGSTSSLLAEEIRLYFTIKTIYYSLFDSIARKNKLVEYQVIGYMEFVRSYSEKREPKYYFIKDGLLTDLTPYEADIESFLEVFIPNYKLFREKYQKKILYDYKSLAEVASAYNTYMFPDKYVFVKYKNRETMVKSGYVSLSINKLKLNDFETFNLFGYSLGVSMENKYSKNASLFVLTTFSQKKGSNSIGKINLSTLELDLFLGITLFQNNTHKWLFGPGLGVNYNIKSYVKQFMHSVTEKSEFGFKNLGVGIDLSLIMSFYKKHKIYINWGKSRVQTNQVTLGPTPDSRRKGAYTGVNMGYSYAF